MKMAIRTFSGLIVFLVVSLDAEGRGFGGGARVGGGGFSAGRVGGGFSGGGFSGGYRGTSAIGQFGGSGASSFRSTGPVLGPAGGVRQGGAGSGSYTTNRGTTINYGGAGVRGTTPGGIDYGRGVGGVNVTTPGGQTFNKVGTAGGAIGPGGTAVGGRSSISAGSGPGGSFVTGSRGVGAIGPGGVAVGGSSRVGAATGPAGNTVVGGSRAGGVIGPGGAAGYQSGFAAGPYAAVSSRSGFAADPYGAVAGRTTVARGYGTYAVSRTGLATQGAYVRRGFNYYNTFTPGWYGRYPSCWYARGWAAGRAWTTATWGGVYPYCGFVATPVYYDYGDTIVYNNDIVYQNGEQIATAADYAQQATQIANTGRDVDAADSDDWQPLGVFALVQGDETTSYKIFQFAINKSGVLRGNYYDALSDTTTPLYGSVDRKTQRAAWSIGDKKNIVFEAGIANLTNDETSVLVHFSPDNTQQFSLVRVPPKKDE